MGLRFVKDYLQHRFNAATRHGTHSPFVYKLADEVIYKRTKEPSFKEIESHRSELLRDERLITITDLGAGSMINDRKTKKVRQIAANALKTTNLAQLLYRLVRAQQPANVVELGTCLGITTAYLAKAAPDAEILTIEGCPETAAIAWEGFTKLNLSNIELQVGNFDDLLPAAIDKFEKLDVVYVDGNHRKDATIDYFNLCLPKVHEGTLLIFDDIHWSEGMKEAWAYIRSHPDVTVTIDLFWVGLVYFRKGQAREHFKLKI